MEIQGRQLKVLAEVTRALQQDFLFFSVYVDYGPVIYYIFSV